MVKIGVLTAAQRARYRLATLAGASLAVLAALTTAPALAQTVPDPSILPPPVFTQIDANGVDLIGGTVNFAGGEIAIGPASGGLSYSYLGIGNIAANAEYGYISVSGTNYSVSIDGAKEVFSLSGTLGAGGTFTSLQGTGATLSYAAATGYTYTKPDGTIAVFSISVVDRPLQAAALISSYKRPSGETWTYAFKQTTTPGPRGNTFQVSRLQSISSNRGYRLQFGYQADTIPAQSFLNLTSVQVVNTATDYCAATANICANTSQTWPRVSISKSTNAAGATVTTATDAAGRVMSLTQGPLSTNASVVTKPSGATLTYMTPTTNSINVSDGTGTWSYNWTDSGTTRTMVVTDPNNFKRTVISNTTTQTVTTDTDARNNITSYAYDTNSRITRLVQPEGNSADYTYDTRGNVTKAVFTPKPGSTLAPITLTASYDATCAAKVKCNKPNSTTDALLRTTYYTYSTVHGGVLSVKRPADSKGVSPVQAYSYVQVPTYTKSASGALTQSGSIWSLSSVQTCVASAGTVTATTSSATLACATGPTDLLRTNIAYTGSLNGLPTSQTQTTGAGGSSATTNLAYNALGDIASVQGPLGAVQTTTYSYDALRRLTGLVNPDPDATAPLPSTATRLTYAPDGQKATVTVGSLPNPADWSSFSALRQQVYSYNSTGRLAQQSLVAGGETISLSQFTYDAAGNLSCSALRQTPSAYSALPASACVVSVANTASPDQITRYVYDELGRVSQVQEGYGSDQQATSVTNGYSANGNLITLKDARGNLTSQTFDGFNRLKQVNFPSTTVGAGAANASDYESYDYDAAGNLLTLHRRDGNLINVTYDLLNRPLTKAVPGQSTIYYGYDLLSRPLSATYGSATGAGVRYGYDGLGRLSTETTAAGQVTYGYDAAGRLTSLTWPGPFSVNYGYDNAGQLTSAAEPGGYSLATYSYDGFGRLSTLTRGNGTSTAHEYDTASRLSRLSHSFPASSTANVSWTFSYSAANQIQSRTLSNPAYRWTPPMATSAKTFDGLNRDAGYVALASGYDARGNLTSDGTRTFTYDVENRLRTAAGSATAALFYDPLGRLSQSVINGQTTQFLYAGSVLIAELDSLGNVLRRYAQGAGTDAPLVWYEGSGTTQRRFLHADRLGSIIGWSDAGGVSQGTRAYGPYGEPSNWSGPRFAYTGQIALPQLSLYHYKARAYDPAQGRFLQTDPSLYGDGMNLYAYVRGDPLNGTDPSGLASNAQCSKASHDECPWVGDYPYWGDPGGDRGNWIDELKVTGSKPDEPKLPAPDFSAPFSFATLSVPSYTSDNYRGPGSNTPQNGQSMAAKMSEDEQEAENEKDEAICRSLPTAGQRGRCWASAGDRRGARAGGRPLPPLVTWRTSMPGPTLPRPSEPSPWVTGGLIVGGAGVVCVIVEPCGAAALGVLGLGSLGLLGAQ